MRIRSASFCNLANFRKPTTVDLDAVSGPVVAVWGDNGEGKTMFLEFLYAGIFRSMRTRGALKRLARGRDAYLEVVVDSIASFRARQTFGSNNKQEASLVNCATGEPYMSSTKVSEFDEKIAGMVPPEAALYSSTFLSQSSGGIIDLDPGPRKGVVLRLIGLEHYEEQNKQASAEADRIAVALGIVVGKESMVASQGMGIDSARAALRAAEEAREANREARLALEASLAESVERNASAEEYNRAIASLVTERTNAVQRATELAEQRRGIQRRIDALLDPDGEMSIPDVHVRIEGIGRIMARADVIRQTVARDIALAEECERNAARQAAISAELDAAKTSKAEKAERWRSSDAERQRAAALMAESAATIARKTYIELAVGLADELRAAVAAAEALIGELEDELQRASEKTLDVSTKRIALLRAGHESIANGTQKWEFARDIAAGTITADECTRIEAATAPAEIARIRAKIGEAKRTLGEKRKALDDANKLAAEMHLVTAATDTHARATEAHALFSKACIQIAEDGQALAQKIETLATERKTIEDRATEIGRVRGELATDIERAQLLNGIEERLAERRAQLGRMEAELERLRADLAAVPADPVLPDVGEPKTLVDVGDMERRLLELDKTAPVLERAVASAESAVTVAAEREASLESIRVERARLEEELADWRLIQEGTGRNGLQALEIDAAGPELTTLANDLLRSCFGPRFVVEWVTTKPKDDGSGDKEGLWIMITDTVAGRTDEAKTYSGGERVFIGEACCLAILIKLCKAYKLREPTIIRDESGAALFEGKAAAYLTMLRRAAEQVNASKILLVTHNSELRDQADGRLTVSNGCIIPS